jgi:hypothetical protein
LPAFRSARSVGARLRVEDRVDLVEQERWTVGVKLAEDNGFGGHDDSPRVCNQHFEDVEKARLAASLFCGRDRKKRALFPCIKRERVHGPERDRRGLCGRHGDVAAPERAEHVQEFGSLGRLLGYDLSAWLSGPPIGPFAFHGPPRLSSAMKRSSSRGSKR